MGRRKALRLSSTAVFLLLSAHLISVADAQPPSAAFYEEKLSLRVTEGVAAGTVIGSIEKKPNYTYRLNERSRFFDFDPDSGEIKTINELDREQLNGDSVDLIILGTPAYFITVTVHVDDVNDNDPVFPFPFQNISVVESASVGTRLVLHSAQDPDAGDNGKIKEYRVASTDDAADTFKLVESTNPDGDNVILLDITKALDREKRDLYVLNISAIDSGEPPRAGFVTVFVNVLDTNDNAPMFSRAHYDVAISETTDAGTQLLVVNATDADAGENAQVVYYLSNDLKNQFQVDGLTGAISTKVKKLDCPRTCQPDQQRNCTRVCVFTVEADDHGSPKQSGRAFVNVRLIDENDHDPEIVFRLYPPGVTFASVDEAAVNGSTVAVLTVVDKDFDANGQADVRIAAGNELGHFRLEAGENYAILRVSEVLHREQVSSYNLTFIAQDHGTPPRSSTKSLQVFVRNVNDRPPNFAQSSYDVQLSEAAPIGSFVVAVSAKTNNSTQHQQAPSSIIYSISTGNELGYFRIAQKTGLITLAKPVDYETTRLYNLTVAARNDGPSIQFSTTKVTVAVLDANDHRPQFADDLKELFVNENLPRGSVLAILRASDGDEGENGRLSFYLDAASNRTYPSQFAVDPESGKLILSRPLDRELLDSYYITVHVKDNGTPPLTDQINLKLNVIDANDNWPTFHPVEYFASILKTDPPGTPITQVIATDTDAGANGTVFYFILQAPVGAFDLDTTSGRLSLRKAADALGSVSPVEVVVGARDGGDLEAVNNATVHVFLLDDFSQTPQFVSPKSKFMVKEKLPGGQVIGTLSATDADNRVEYRLIGSDAFDIGRFSGEIRTNRPLDRETTPVEELLVVAKGKLAASAITVNVMVEDVNDEAPIFLVRANVTVTVSRDRPAGYPLLLAAATDADDEFNQITYSLRNASDFIFVNNVTGLISLKSPGYLLPDKHIAVDVIAQNVESPSQSASTTVIISPIPAADLVFPQSHFTFVLSENAKVNSIVHTINYASGFMDVTVVFEAEAQNDQAPFGVFPDGKIFIKNALDFETMQSYSLPIIATADFVNGRRTTTKIVADFYLLDENDNAPKCDLELFDFELQENAPVGTYIGRAKATDIDSGLNGKLAYRLLTENDNFLIDSTTGSMTSLVVFDREDMLLRSKTDTLTMRIRVSDQGEPKLTVECAVRVRITDGNDHSPEFLLDIYAADVLENAAIGAEVLKVTATDADQGDNAHISYHLADDFNTFSLNETTGMLTLKAPLDRETKDSYLLSIEARDGGRPSQSTLVPTVISVIDVNDQAPKFINYPKKALNISENLPVGSEIAAFTAEDDDVGLAGRCRYFISTGNIGRTFEIDPVTGRMILIRPLDFEETPAYTLTVSANDEGSPSLSASVPLVINVIDENDNAPIIVTAIGQVQENAPIEKPILTLSATDADSGVNGQIKFKILEQSPASAFTVKGDKIYAETALDRETVEQYQLLIQASDLGQPPLTSQRHITIIVTDQNDNPPRWVGIRAATVDASSPSVSKPIALMRAVDDDAGLNGSVGYRLTRESDNLFTMTADGQLFLSEPLRNPLPLYRLSVEAMDRTDLSGRSARKVNDFDRRSTEVQFTVITAVQSSALNFPTKEYRFELTEDTKVGTEIGNVRASGVSGGKIVYFVTDAHSNSSWGTANIDQVTIDVDEKSGQLRVVAPLDREKTGGALFLTVHAVNAGANGPQTAHCTVTITILDVNDEPPTVAKTDYTFKVSESAHVGSEIGLVEASDPDLSGTITYSWSNTVSSSPFALNPQSGLITLKSALDRETTAEYRLTMIISDSVNSVSITVRVVVTDENDNKPNFTFPGVDSFYSFLVPEGAQRNSFIGRVEATDPDEARNGQVKYFIQTPGLDQVFHLDENSGILTVNGYIDHETIPLFSFRIRATDVGIPALSTEADVFVVVQDANDNQPKFDPAIYEIAVAENTTIGSKLIHLRATDVDTDTDFHYKIQSGDPNGLFSIDDDGNVVLAKQLDRETRAVHQLTVRVTDQAPSIFHHWANAQLTVTVLDVNDNPPVFVSATRLIVRENSPIGTVISVLKAVDVDEGLAGQVEYRLNSASVPDGVFTVDPVLGYLKVNGPIDRESRSSYNLSIIAYDRGSPSLSTEQFIELDVLDANDNYPSFTSHPGRVQVAENAVVGQRIVQLSATDMDIDENAAVVFWIAGGDEEHHFAIDPDSGALSLTRPLNFEEKRVYNLTLAVANLVGGPMSQTSLVIQVTDANDHRPTFPKDPIYIDVVENLSEPFPVAIGTTLAEDLDTGLNGKLSYSIVQGNTTVFRLDPMSGQLYSTLPLDREIQETYHLVVQVTDAGSPRLSSTGRVIITVLDSNDNAPVFNQPYYRAEIAENATVGTKVLPVTATDSDKSANGAIHYSLRKSDGTLPFTIDSETGVISTNNLLDRETVSSWTMTVIAEDSGEILRLSSSINVTVTILDINDNAPIIRNGHLDVYIKNMLNSGDFVYAVDAFDPDEGVNGQLTFELSGKDAAKFSIDQNGVIVSSVSVKALDTFSLMATVYDGLGLNATTALSFYVRFANDFPVFKAAGIHLSKSIEVSEMRKNVPLTTILARSSKQAPTNKIRYSIAAGDPRGVFKIGASSGHLSTTDKLDREEKDTYRLWIAATDSDNPPLSSYIAINVTVVDVNDNDPEFEHVVYDALIQENTPAPTIVTTVRAIDRDSGANAEIKYRIVAGDDEQVFEINAKTGAITTAIELDRERASKYRLVVEAEDQGTPKRSAKCVVRITVGDENDSSPRFTRLFTASVSEDAPIGTFVTQVTSLDLDSDEYSNNTYYLSSNPGRKFDIDPQSGNVTLIAPLDREAVSEYQLKVIAADGSWRVETSLTVTVDDVNDNAPQFQPTAVPFAVTEKQPAGTVVGRMTAVDADASGSVNALISYSLKSRSDAFAIDSKTGEITTTASLVFRRGSGANQTGNLHQLTVVATDSGRPPLKSETTVNVQVIERNDHSPIFQKPSYRFAVAPTTPVGTILGRVNATDEDDGPNGQISYTIQSKKGGSEIRYEVNAISGTVALKLQALAVVGTVEKFEIRAQDHGSPSRQQTVPVQIEVVAPNHHSPEFSMARFELTVSETAPVGTAVTKFFARDADEGLNGVLQYSLIAIVGIPFAINSDDGTLTVTAPLDFEARANYSFLIMIADKGIPSKNSSAPVFIAIKDENDNAPEFEFDTIDVHVRENAPLGTRVVQIAANDKDGPPHNIVEYQMVTIGEVPFALNSSTGEVYVAGRIDFEQAQRYSLGVIARNPGSTANAKLVVNVHVISENEFSPKFNESQRSFQVGRQAAVGSLVGTVTAVDEDAGPDGIIYYFLDHLSQKKGFAIDRLTGKITVAEPLIDKNTDGKLTVLAENRRASSIREIARCSVSIEMNDTMSAGVFDRPTYEAKIAEDAPIGSNVVQLKATVINGGRFEVASGDSNRVFGIDSKTGLIQVRGPMDRETVDVYELTVNLVNEARITSTTQVKITVADANDNGPQVIEGNRFGFITEGDPVGTNILTIRPVDKDLPPNQGPFKFRLNSPEMATLFEIDEKTGVLRSRAVFDREHQAIYRIPIAITDAGKPPRTTTSIIEVGVNDLNDMPSLNASIQATVYLIDGIHSGPIGSVRPADTDLVGEYACKVASGDAPNLFHMSDGCELVSGRIGSSGSYHFNLSGTDGAHPWIHYLLTINCESLTQEEANEAVRVVIDGTKDDIPSFADKLNALMEKSGRSVKLISLNSTGILSHQAFFTVYEKDALLGGTQAEDALRKATQELQQNVRQQTTNNLQIEATAHDLCSKSTCRNGGRCSMTTNMENTTTIYLRGQTHLLAMPKIDRQIVCDCPRTHTGLNCEIAVDHCKDNPCSNGGTCSTQNGSVMCLCPEGFEGQLCEQDKNECEDGPCQNGGYCENTNGAFRCICLIGFAGRACETAVDHCDSNPCQNGATCEKNQEGFTCKCPFGFRGKHCEIISYGFGPLSYVELPRMNPHQNYLGLEFATKSKNALLLYSYNLAQGSQDYVAVDIVDGRLRLSARLSDQGHMNIILDRKVDDGQWYQLQIDHKYQSVTISVGPCPDEESQCQPCPLSDGSCRKTAYTGIAQILVPGESIFLGGIRNFADVIVRPGQVSAIDFIGCIRGFDLNGKSLETIEIRSKANLLDHCPRPEGGHCPSDVSVPDCQGGRCIDDWDAPRCVCKDGYEARSCVDASTPASFNGGLIKYTLSEHTKRMLLFQPVDTETLVNSDDLFRAKRYADPGTWFELDIRTLSTEGLVFFAASGADFSMIDINNGTLRYLSKISDRPAVQVLLDTPVNDGLWHRVSLELSRDNYSAQLRMDGSGKEARSRLPLHSFLTPSINFLALGGVIRSENGPSLVQVYGVKVPDFTGCMNRFVVNNEAQPLTSSGDDSSSSSHFFDSTLIGRVVEGCSSPMGCIDPPCSSEPMTSKSTWTMALVAVVAFFSLCILLVILAWVAKKRWRRAHKKSPTSNSKFSNLALVSNSGQLLNGSTMSLKDQASGGFGRDNAGFLSRDSDLSSSRLSFSTTQRASSVQLDPTCSINRDHHRQRQELYDLDNASSIAPSDVDVSYHYRCYRETTNTNSSRRKKNPKLEKAQTDARGQSPLSQLQAMSQMRHSTPHRDSPTSVKALKAALRASPPSAVSSVGRSMPMTCTSSTSEEERRTGESSRTRRSTRSRRSRESRSRDSSSRRKKIAPSSSMGGCELQSVKDVRRYHSNPAFEDDDSSSSGPSPPRPAVPPRASILSAVASRSPHAPPRRDSSDDQTTDLDLDRVRRPRRLLSGVMDDTETESEFGGIRAGKATVPSSLAPFRPPRTMFPVSEDESDAGVFQMVSSSSTAPDRTGTTQKSAQLPNWYHQEGEGGSVDDQSDDEPPLDSRNLEAYV